MTCKLEPGHLQIAKKAARAAGAIIKNRFGTPFEVSYKSSKDPVTEIDQACEKQIKCILSCAYPNIAFWGEESGSTDSTASLTWVVDPLDGTKNFVHGYPFVAVSIALVSNSEPILGVVFDPLRDEMFWGQKSCGAFLDCKPITVSHTSSLEDAMVVTNLNPWPAEQGPLILKAGQQCQGLRRGGASALDLCQLAAGRLDAIWEWSLKPWDLAAATLIIQEAQGTVTRLDGSPFELLGGQILATNTNLHGAFRDFLGLA